MARSDALIKTQNKYKQKTASKQKYWQYKSYTKKFIDEMATEDDLRTLIEMINNRMDETNKS